MIFMFISIARKNEHFIAENLNKLLTLKGNDIIGFFDDSS